MSEVQRPIPGVSIWTNPSGVRIFELHYSADPERGEGEKVWVPEIKKWLSPWAFKQYQGMTNKNSYLQEYEIDATAKLGTLLYQFEEEATLEKSFPIPAHWTRYFALDPHPRLPHAFLWAAVDPWGDAWIYRELWPSKCCLRYEAGRLVGDKGNNPEDDNRFRVRQYIETVKWLESPENDLVCHDGRTESELLKDKPENIYQRVIDYAARGFFDTTDSDDERNLQQRYEDWSRHPEVDYPLTFADAIKDRDSGIEIVNDWLRPRKVEARDGTFKAKSKLHIFEDKCPELIHQLSTNRYEQLSATMADKVDPLSKPRKKRNHLTDDLRYLCMAGLEFVKPFNVKALSNWKPIFKGVAY